MLCPPPSNLYTELVLWYPPLFSTKSCSVMAPPPSLISTQSWCYGGYTRLGLLEEQSLTFPDLTSCLLVKISHFSPDPDPAAPLAQIRSRCGVAGILLVGLSRQATGWDSNGRGAGKMSSCLNIHVEPTLEYEVQL